MTSTAWQLQNHLACLHTDTLSASIDLKQPSQGLVGLVLDARSDVFRHCQLLGLELPSLASGDETLLDQYVRGSDLAAVYTPSEAWPIRVDVVWHAIQGSQPPTSLAAIDVLVSVRTERLDSRPELAVVSRLPAGEVLRLSDVESARFDLLNVAPETPLSIDSQAGPGCQLFRLPEAEVSYVEMVHPLDFQQDELAAREDGHIAACLRHRLFSLSLEKGVILRARVRGAFVPRHDDTQRAAAAFAAFAAEEPLLST